MTVRLEGSIQRWIGLSDDIKPKLSDGPIPLGSSYLESDTGLILRWTGEAWSLPAQNDDLVNLLGTMVQVLGEIRELLELSTGNSPG